MLIAATSNDTTAPTARNGRNKIQGGIPAAFITMSSESLPTLLSTWATAIISAIGAVSGTRGGMMSAVMPTHTKMLWPWFVIRSMSRSACVIHISAVTLVQMTRNAPKVVRKIYRPMDPMRLRVPAHGKTPARATPCRQLRFRQTSPFYPFLDRPTKWPRQGKPFEYAQQFVNREGLGGAAWCRSPGGIL